MSSKKIYKFKAQVWRWPGVGGWHFVNLPKKLSQEVKKVGKPYGAGFIKIKATVVGNSWTTALFPHKKSDTYLLSIKNIIRKKEGIFENDTVSMSFTII